MAERLECSEISVGARFDAPVFFDDGVNMFLAPGHPVKQYHLEVIKRWGIPFLMTGGHRIDEEYVAVHGYQSFEDDGLEALDELEPLEDVQELEEVPPADSGFAPVAAASRQESLLEPVPMADFVEELESADAPSSDSAKDIPPVADSANAVSEEQPSMGQLTETERMDRLAEKLMAIEPKELDKTSGRAEIEDILSSVEFDEAFAEDEDAQELEEL